MVTSPSTDRGEFSVALKVSPGWFLSESIGSTRRTANVVPAGMVTFCGGGGAGGGAGAAGVIESWWAIAMSVPIPALSSAPWEDSLVAERFLCVSFLVAGAGLGVSTGAGGACSSATAGAGAICRLLTTCLTPGIADE